MSMSLYKYIHRRVRRVCNCVCVYVMFEMAHAQSLVHMCYTSIIMNSVFHAQCKQCHVGSVSFYIQTNDERINEKKASIAFG